MSLAAGLFTTTDLIVVVTTLLIFAFDAWLLQKKGEASTISWRAVYWGKRAGIIWVLIGILIGHLSWPNHAWCQP